MLKRPFCRGDNLRLVAIIQSVSSLPGDMTNSNATCWVCEQWTLCESDLKNGLIFILWFDLVTVNMATSAHWFYILVIYNNSSTEKKIMCFLRRPAHVSGSFCGNQNCFSFSGSQTISICDHGDQNRSLKLNHDVFLTLTKSFLCVNCTRA